MSVINKQIPNSVKINTYNKRHIINEAQVALVKQNVVHKYLKIFEF